MPARNTPLGYGWVARFFHWTMAALILTEIALSLYAASLPTVAQHQLSAALRAFSVHKTIGVAVLVLAVLRILWAITQPSPAPLHPERRAETLLARVVHWGLYAGMIVMPLSGLLRHASVPGEFAPILWPFGQRLPGVPVDLATSTALSAIHQTSWLVLAVLIALHVLGTVRHVLFDRDATLARMIGPASRLTQPPIGPQPPAFVAPLLALAIWAATIAAAPMLVDWPGPAAGPQAAATPPSTAEAAQWVVQDGTLAISVNQGGSPVSGRFVEWDAAIAFDPGTGTGHVTVSIPVGSLTLGAITTSALGAEFLKAEEFPLATFAAEITPTDQGHVANGRMTLAGTEAPVALPFKLDIDGDRATMSGQTRIDRRDFGVGESYADETTVGFSVQVDVTLTATRQ